MAIGVFGTATRGSRGIGPEHHGGGREGALGFFDVATVRHRVRSDNSELQGMQHEVSQEKRPCVDLQRTAGLGCMQGWITSPGSTLASEVDGRTARYRPADADQSPAPVDDHRTDPKDRRNFAHFVLNACPWRFGLTGRGTPSPGARNEPMLCNSAAWRSSTDVS